MIPAKAESVASTTIEVAKIAKTISTKIFNIVSIFPKKSFIPSLLPGI